MAHQKPPSAASPPRVPSPTLVPPSTAVGGHSTRSAAPGSETALRHAQDGPCSLPSPAVEGEAAPHLPVPALLGFEAFAGPGRFPGEAVLCFHSLAGLDVDPVVGGKAARIVW